MEIPTYSEIKEHPFRYLYLRRKRQFKMGDTDVIYGEGEQTKFTVVFTPDTLEHQYSLMDLEIRSKQLPEPKISTYKNEFFYIEDPEIQKHIHRDDASKMVDLLGVFLETADWRMELNQIYIQDTESFL